MSPTVDISLTQIALIAAETAAMIRRFFPQSGPMIDLADRVERFLSVRADSAEARLRAAELLRAWEKVEGTPEQRELMLVHRKLRGIGNQDRAVERLRRLENVLAAAPAGRRSGRRKRAAS